MLKSFNERINGIKFTVSAEKAVKEQVRGLFGLVGKIPREKLRDGFRVEMGFSVFTFREKRGAYQILAPDYDGDPFRETTEDLTRALLLMDAQMTVLKRHRLYGAPCRFDDRILLTKGALEQPLLSMERTPGASGGNSGWFLRGLRKTEEGQLEPISPEGFEEQEALSPEACESLSAWQLLDRRSAAAELLLLPYGYCAVLEGDEVLELLNEKDESLLGG